MPKSTTDRNSNTKAVRAMDTPCSAISLSERDSLRVIELLENPLAPNARLKAAARASRSMTVLNSTTSYQLSSPA